MGRYATFNFLFGLWSWSKDLVKCLGPQQTHYHQWCQEVWRRGKGVRHQSNLPISHPQFESQNALGCLLAYVGWTFATCCFHATCLNHLLPNGLVGSNTIFVYQNSHILSISQIPPKIRTSGSWTSTTPKHCNPNYPHCCVSRAKNDVFHSGSSTNGWVKRGDLRIIQKYCWWQELNTYSVTWTAYPYIFYIITSQYLNSFTVVFPSKVVAWWNKNLEDATLPIKRRLGWFVKDLHGSCPRPSRYRIFTYIYMNGWFFLGAMKLNIPIPWMCHGARCLSSHTSSLILQLGTCTPLEKMLDETSERRSHGITGDYQSYLLQLTLPLIFMVQWKMGPEKISCFLSFGAG